MRKGIDCKGREWEESVIYGKMIDVTNLRFEKLVPLFPVKSKGKSKWLCQCDCGNEIAVSYGNFNGGQTQSCGCLGKEKRSKTNKERWEKYRKDSNVIGQTFGRLTVKEFIGVVDCVAVYSFECLCGGGITTTLNSVKQGNTKSCGCLRREFIESYKTDILNQKFNKLLVLSYAGVNKRDENTFLCKCDCGELTIVSRNCLVTGSIKSCGCLRSIGENNIKTLLDDAEIRYEQQKSFADLISDSGGYPLYDFALLDIDDIPIRLIEFDGLQHEKPYDYFGGEEKFLKVQANDILKNQYALSHNIPLVRIPYSKRDTMTLDDLLGDKYLIKGDI